MRSARGLYGSSPLPDRRADAAIPSLPPPHFGAATGPSSSASRRTRSRHPIRRRRKEKRPSQGELGPAAAAGLRATFLPSLPILTAGCTDPGHRESLRPQDVIKENNLYSTLTPGRAIPSPLLFCASWTPSLCRHSCVLFAPLPPPPSPPPAPAPHTDLAVRLPGKTKSPHRSSPDCRKKALEERL